MNKNELEHFKSVLKKIEKEMDNNDIIKKNIKQRLKRIINEVGFCVSYSLENEYFPLQQFRPLMDKIINVIHFRDERVKYLEYLEALEEFEEIKSRRKYLSKRRMSAIEVMDREKFFKKRLINIRINIDDIKEYKFKRFEYWIGYLCNDSSRVLHDDNSTYNNNLDETTLKNIEQIILFFVTNIFISFCKSNKDKDYLKGIHRSNKRKLKTNKWIKKKPLKVLKEELRGIV
ncbi:hypothetical protein AB2T85_17765 [Clostridium butyricum]|uniref:hypothetical protein n=1 Tax=Clostridium butyricum TaxID=1492 RepID=UPI00346560F3